jgi:hypothetical protein
MLGFSSRRLSEMSDSISYQGKDYFRHPLSAVFPAASEDEYNLLKSSISEVGLLEPIKLTGSNEDQVFDGWHRLKACLDTEVQARFDIVTVDSNLYALTFALNIARRHLSASQKSLIAGQLSTMPRGYRADLSENAKSSGLRTISYEVPTDGPATSIDGTHDPKDTDFHQSPTETTPPSLSQTAALLGIGRTTAALGKAIINSGNQVLIDSVKRGEISLHEGGAIARQNRELQADHIKTRLAEGKAGLSEDSKLLKASKRLANLIKKAKPLPDEVTAAQTSSALSLVAHELRPLVSVFNNIDLADTTLMGPLTIDFLYEPVKELAARLEAAKKR